MSDALSKLFYEKDPLGTAATIEVTRAELEALLGIDCKHRDSARGVCRDKCDDNA